jgi:hypothetical protein
MPGDKEKNINEKFSWLRVGLLPVFICHSSRLLGPMRAGEGVMLMRLLNGATDRRE